MASIKARLPQLVSLFPRRWVPRLLEFFSGPRQLRSTAFAGTLLSALALLSPGLVISQSTTQLEREVNGQTLASRSLPSIDLSFSNDFRYAGSQRFVLYQVADAEQHFFVDADENKRVRRLFWVQFEHFLPGNSEHYDYKPLRETKIGDLTFIYDSKLYADYAGLKPGPDSDGARGRALLAKAGFTLPQSAARVRLIHLPVSDKRSELMIIYLESTTPDRLPRGSKAEMPADDEFPQWSEFLLTHLRESLKIERRQRQPETTPGTFRKPFSLGSHNCLIPPQYLLISSAYRNTTVSTGTSKEHSLPNRMLFCVQAVDDFGRARDPAFVLRVTNHVPK